MGFNRNSYHNLKQTFFMEHIIPKYTIAVEFGVQQSWFVSTEFPKSQYFKDVIGIGFKQFHSFDLDPVEGVIITDLSKPLQLENTVDLLLNFGTAEHVGDTLREQYQFWLNVHNICREGGHMIHDNPQVGSWGGHCRWYYDERFFKELASKSSYKFIEYKSYPISDQGYSIYCVLRKGQGEFISFEDFREIVHEDRMFTHSS